MTKGVRIPSAIVLATLLCGCHNTTKSTQAPKDLPFPSVQVPSLITEPQERTLFIADNMWNGLLDTTRHFLCDSSYVSGVSVDAIEEKVGLYTTLLNQLPLDKARNSVKNLFSRLETLEKKDPSSNAFEVLTKMLRRYLYDPNSPVRNEDIWQPFVEALSKSSLAGDLALSYDYESKMCSLNRVGTKAADFSFKSLEGKVETLWGIPAEYTLLFFSNPGCENCKQIIDYLQNDPKIGENVAKGTLAVVNVYIDENVDSWKEYASTYPKTWHNGYDFGYTIRTDVLYNVRAIPSLYILDKDKKVIMKDAPQDKAFAFLDESL